MELASGPATSAVIVNGTWAAIGSPALLTPAGATRCLALYEDKVFLSTYDAAIVALDARTGEQVWRTAKVDYTQGFTQTSADHRQRRRRERHQRLRAVH